MDQSKKDLIITLQYLDTLPADAEAQEKIFIRSDGVVAVFAIPCVTRGVMDQLMWELSRLVQRDTLLDISKKN